MGQNILQSFKRVEKKYILTPAQYNALYKGMMPYMKKDEYGQYTICNIYYDTDNFELIRTSIEKPVYKEKLRLRSYGTPTDSENVFVEIKKKYDHVVYKRRAFIPCNDAVKYLAGNAFPQNPDQIWQEIGWFLKSYQPKPKVFISYDRIALAGIENSELRVTFDTNVRWRDYDLDLRMGNYGEAILSGDQILMEIKIPQAVPLWLCHLLSKLNIRPTSFSKYGTCYRTHLFKQAVPKINMPVMPCMQTYPHRIKHLKEAYFHV